MKPTTVYWIYGEAMTPLYVGVTGNLDKRLRAHSEKTWWLAVRRIDTKEYETREAALEVERKEIMRLNPTWNRVHNTGGVTPARNAIPRANVGGRRRLVTVNVAADYVGMNAKTIRRRVADGTLTGYRFGPRAVRVDLDEVDALLKPIPTVGTF